jgi:hypothetical protein
VNFAINQKRTFVGASWMSRRNPVPALAMLAPVP